VARLRAKEPVAGPHSEDSKIWLTLIHIEIESPDRTVQLKPRLPRYYIHLREQYGLPVLPIVIYLKVGLDGIGIDVYEESIWNLTPLRFSYMYVGLPGLDAIQYVEGDNWLGVALSALMRIPEDRVAWLGAEALRRLTESPLTEQQKFLLADCVEAYLPLDEDNQRKFQELVMGGSHNKVQAMNKTTFEKGMEKGMEKGLEKGIGGIQRVILRLGAKQLGSPPVEIEARIRAIDDVAWLEDMAVRLADVSSWAELLQAN
jgi:hypothetical protein